jgi:hypothetical protein
VAIRRTASRRCLDPNQIVDRNQLSELHYIVSIANVPSILAQGLLCHNLARRLAHTSVAMPEIQERRKEKRIPNRRRLHDYVNLYINARNPMMFKVKAIHGIDSLCVLSVSPDVLDLEGAIIADQNAASGFVRFYPAPEGLSVIDHARVFAESWIHVDDQIAEWQHKSAMCAEVLVPRSVEPTFLKCGYVGSELAEQHLKSAAPGLGVLRYDYLFFG